MATITRQHLSDVAFARNAFSASGRAVDARALLSALTRVRLLDLEERVSDAQAVQMAECWLDALDEAQEAFEADERDEDIGDGLREGSYYA